MNFSSSTFPALMFSGCLLLGTAQAQSLGETARELRPNRPVQTSDKVLTNDDLGRPLVSGIESDSSDEAKNSEPKSDASKITDKTAEKKAGEVKESKSEEDLAAKLSDQKQQITQAERELDVLERENKLRASSYYGDAGARLRDPKKFAEDDRKYQADIAAKQKELEQSKSKLDDMKEEARKAGLPASDRE
jgi:hypothetical protein